MINQWILAGGIFLVWCLWVLACAIAVAASDARRGVPPGERRRTSCLPGIPLFPVVFWGIAWIINRLFPSWGTITVGGFHVLFAIVLIVVIVRDLRCIRSVDGPSRPGDTDEQ